LRDALSKHNDIDNSLIVLPEAFNNGEIYCDQPCRQPLIRADDILRCLASIARERDLIFVAGLLDPPNNSAYLIDNGRPRLMVHKQAHCNIDNPIEISDACIGALICSDARDNYQMVTDKAGESIRAHKVICIPASMSAGTFDSPSFPLSGYRNKYVVLANGKPPLDTCGSFLANKVGSKVGNRNFNCPHNAIFLATWSELDDLGT